MNDKIPLCPKCNGFPVLKYHFCEDYEELLNMILLINHISWLNLLMMDLLLGLLVLINETNP